MPTIAKPLKIVLSGASGKMGQAILSIAQSNPANFQIVGVLGRENHLEQNPRVYTELGNITAEMDVIIDFSRPEFSLKVLQQAADKKIAFVSGTTGFTDEQLQQIQLFSQQAPLLIAANMSIGVNLAVELVKLTSLVLGEEAKVEISEAHHQHKTDAPSGTALHLGEAIAKTRQQQLKALMQYEENSIVATDQSNKIEFHVRREGEIIGDHSVTFKMASEEISIKHHAIDRKLFAKGALLAANWLALKKPGYYQMSEVLDLKAKLAEIYP